MATTRVYHVVVTGQPRKMPHAEGFGVGKKFPTPTPTQTKNYIEPYQLRISVIAIKVYRPTLGW